MVACDTILKEFPLQNWMLDHAILMWCLKAKWYSYMQEFMEWSANVNELISDFTFTYVCMKLVSLLWSWFHNNIKLDFGNFRQKFCWLSNSLLIYQNYFKNDIKSQPKCPWCKVKKSCFALKWSERSFDYDPDRVISLLSVLQPAASLSKLLIWQLALVASLHRFWPSVLILI